MTDIDRDLIDRLREAAVGLLLEQIPTTRAAMHATRQRYENALRANEHPKANILMGVVLTIQERLEAAQEAQFQAIDWYMWPDDTPGAQGRAADVSGVFLVDYWLEAQPGVGNGFSWETWRVTHRGEEFRVASGEAPTLEEAQRASWVALLAHQEELEDEEPF
jgi:hypothetical protein